MLFPRPERAPTLSHHRVGTLKARAAAGLLVAAVLALTAAPAHAVNTSSTGWHPTSGTDRMFRADNGVTLTYHYYAEGMDWLPAGSGAAFIGGGGTYGQPIAEATPATDDLDLIWVVGHRDGAYATDSGSWSAKAAAAQAEAEYQKAGYDQAQRITTAGAHTDYDISSIVADRLAELGKQPPLPRAHRSCPTSPYEGRLLGSNRWVQRGAARRGSGSRGAGQPRNGRLAARWSSHSFQGRHVKKIIRPQLCDVSPSP